MEKSSRVNEAVALQPHAFPPARPDHLAVLGEPHSSRTSSLHSETDATRPRGRVNTSNILRLLEHQRYCCALTGRQLTPETASLDHIVPVRCGGEHVIENTQVLHKNVNRAKTTMTREEFIQLCREVVAYVDSQLSVSPELRQSA